MFRGAFFVSIVLIGCTPMGPPPVPLLDAGPRLDSGVDAPALDAPDAPAAPDAPLDAPSCDMRADCDSNGSCETALGTVTNCTSCGMACATRPGAAATCDFATGCGFRCNTGFEDCNATPGDGCEVNIATNLMQCGMCGRVCPFGGANTARACVGGDCLPFTCSAGFGDCDGDITTGAAGTGCEINTNTSLANCGMCGRVCSAAANASPTCSAGSCGIACTSGFLNCDSNQANGCEIDGRTDLTNCGMCGRACTVGAAVMNAVPACAASACTFACMAGFSNCDGNGANGCELAASACP